MDLDAELKEIEEMAILMPQDERDYADIYYAADRSEDWGGDEESE